MTLGVLDAKIILGKNPNCKTFRTIWSSLNKKVDEILNSYSNGLEREIDHIIYEIYEFDKKEICFIESQ
ncbi:hypothetical protein NT017_19820 [Prolixibacter sp. NT017]|nr:hypothetical protein NT017_19820 [Prolixibacter sp. NT017]